MVGSFLGFLFGLDLKLIKPQSQKHLEGQVKAQVKAGSFQLTEQEGETPQEEHVLDDDDTLVNITEKHCVHLNPARDESEAKALSQIACLPGQHQGSEAGSFSHLLTALRGLGGEPGL